MTKEITDENFEELLHSAKIVVLDFWAEWCGPCKAISPLIDELAGEYDDSILFGKVNVDENSELSSKFGIRSIPTILFFKDGETVQTPLVGSVSKKHIIDKITAILEA